MDKFVYFTLFCYIIFARTQFFAPNLGLLQKYTPKLSPFLSREAVFSCGGEEFAVWLADWQLCAPAIQSI